MNEKLHSAVVPIYFFCCFTGVPAVAADSGAKGWTRDQHLQLHVSWWSALGGLASSGWEKEGLLCLWSGGRFILLLGRIDPILLFWGLDRFFCFEDWTDSSVWRIGRFFCFEDWPILLFWGLDRFFYFEDWTDSSVLRIGPILLFWGLDRFFCFEDWADSSVLRIGPILLFWGLGRFFCFEDWTLKTAGRFCCLDFVSFFLQEVIRRQYSLYY